MIFLCSKKWWKVRRKEPELAELKSEMVKLERKIQQSLKSTDEMKGKHLLG